MTLGQRIRQARIERGMTQKELVGDQITRNMLSKIENDSAVPSVKTLHFLAMRLGYPAGYFLAGSQYSDGTSPDGLDSMRAAFRAEQYAECLRLLDEAAISGTTDEGYLLRVRCNAALARAALASGDLAAAKEYADEADYYNKQCIYYSPAADAEMSLILAECALGLELPEFERNEAEYLRAVSGFIAPGRYTLDKACYLLRTGETELARRLLETQSDAADGLSVYRLYLRGACSAAEGNAADAAERYSRAERLAAPDDPLLPAIYAGLEHCYKELGDYENAYVYAARQLHRT